MTRSPFLDVPRHDWLAANSLAFAFLDRFPVSPGHALIVTHRVVATWFDATAEEQAAVLQLINQVKSLLDQRLNPRPDGYNIGINCGSAAGQTVMHLHAHVIPRYEGDVSDPRGGVRYVIPDKANYLAEPPTDAAVPLPGDRLALSTSHLWERLSSRMLAAQNIDILVAFVQPSGLDLIESSLFALLQQTSSVRILIGDYFYLSDPRALARLLAWCDLVVSDDTDDRLPGQLQARLFQTQKAGAASFHPKAWRIVDQSGTLVTVGSSNLSRTALLTGVEWNLIASTAPDDQLPQAFDQAFTELWSKADPLTRPLVDAYAVAAKAARQRPVAGQAAEPASQDAVLPLPEPRPWQAEALVALQQLRSTGGRRALVTVATGMGKTWLAALDIVAVGQQLGRRPRVLVIAHRAPILAQAESVIARVLDQLTSPLGDDQAATIELGHNRSSWFTGAASEMDGDLVIASVQKLSRPHGIQRLRDQRFDYVVIDEVHHAQAPTYRRVLAHLQANFILGLTATPERTDGLDVASLFDGNIVYHASIGRGIAEQSLVPFHYLGIRDTVDFQQIPWRSGRFDPEELERQLAVSERMQRLWEAMQQHPAKRTLVFCCSRRHALFARDWLRQQGLAAAAVFSGSDSDPCDQSLEDLRSGRLAALCVVDMFNEGLDIPAIDCVVMLRPTESKVIFLQQLGRGLRASAGKSRLQVIDFVGNHRIFASRIMHLMSLDDQVADWSDLRDWLDHGTATLPPGCLLDVEWQAQDVLRRFLPRRSQADVDTYRALREELGRRPTPTEMLHRNGDPRSISRSAGSWFQFLAAEGDLSPAEQTVLDRHLDWLRTVQSTSLTKSYKMVVLRVLLDQGNLFSAVDIGELATECRRFLMAHPVLHRDPPTAWQTAGMVENDPGWTRWWIKWPIDRWQREQSGHRWFRLHDDGRFESTMAADAADQATLEAMTDELVEWRLAAYVHTRRLPPAALAPEHHAQDDPPLDEQPSDGIRSDRSAVGAVDAADEDFLDGPLIEPAVSEAAKYRTHVPVYDLVAAAGGFGNEMAPEILGWTELRGRRLRPGMFAATVTGRSMEPTIASGSLCLFAPCPAGSREGRLLLVQLSTHASPEDGGRYTVKRYHSVKRSGADDGWQHAAIELQPLNPDFQPIPITAGDADDIRILGEFLGIIDASG